MSPLLAVCCGGCFHSWINDWLDPSEMGSFDTTHTSEIRRSISVLEEPSGLALATDPTPEDLVTYTDEYRIAPSDILTIRIFELIAPGAETLITPIVNEQGSIHIPELGWTPVTGLTARELQAQLVDELRQQELLEEASVEVVVAAQRQRVFYIFGVVARAGAYPISKLDFRLMEALLLAGGLPDVADRVYIFRPSEEGDASWLEETTAPAQTAPSAASGPATDSAPSDAVTSEELEPDTEDQYEYGQMMLTSYSQAATASPSVGADEPGDVPPSGETQPADAAELLDADLLEAIRPPGVEAPEPAPREEPQEWPEAQTQLEPTFEPPPELEEPSQQAPLSHWIWLNGKWIEVTPGQEPGAPETAPGPEERRIARTAPTTSREPVSWEDIEVPPSNRIIAIPADLLREGDARYNIVVRENDTIRVTAGETGQYYMMGHVLRPGVYSLVGLEVTLKQAIAAAGGLDPLAWPDRCDVIRRIGGDRETVIPVNLDRIFAGQDPDFFLKRSDIVNVGTHAVAPFLATIRVAFRLTYGFGFVWDRNFGDIESQGGSPNPRLVRASQQQSLLPGLFP